MKLILATALLLIPGVAFANCYPGKPCPPKCYGVGCYVINPLPDKLAPLTTSPGNGNQGGTGNVVQPFGRATQGAGGTGQSRR